MTLAETLEKFGLTEEEAVQSVIDYIREIAQNVNDTIFKMAVEYDLIDKNENVDYDELLQMMEAEND